MANVGIGELDERVIARAALGAAEEELQTICASHAGTFVSVERRGQSLEVSLKELLDSVQNVESQVTKAQQCLDQEDSEEKEDSLAALSERHRIRRRTLLQHSSLQELLELPSLMDACVRSSMYEEALSIATFANTLERRHGGIIGIENTSVLVMKVIKQVRARQVDLRRYLLHRLKNHVTMPQCLEVVTALRRLNSIDLERKKSEKANLERMHSAMELRLEIDFLEARDAWLDSPMNITNSGTSKTPSALNVPLRSSEQLLDTIERFRTRIFEIATQYNAIFHVAEPQSDAALVLGVGSVSLLSMWVSRRVNTFLHMLSVQLKRMDDTASLRDALEACVFFSTSLGRLGADFTAQLPPLFETRMHTIIVHQSWLIGKNQFSEVLKVCRNVGVASPLVSNDKSQHNNTKADDLSSSLMETTGNNNNAGPMPPPRLLMALPPVARFVNSILSGMNDLRRCLLPGIFNKLRISLDELLVDIKSTLQMNDRAVNAPGFRGEAVALRNVSAQMMNVFATIVDPYLRGSLELALGNDIGAKIFHDRLLKKKEEPEIENENDDKKIETEKVGESSVENTDKIDVAQIGENGDKNKDVGEKKDEETANIPSEGNIDKEKEVTDVHLELPSDSNNDNAPSNKE